MIRRTLAASTVLVAATVTLSSISSATALASAAAAPVSDRASAYTVDAHVKRTEPLVGDVVKVKGTVSPAAPGAKVKLQVKYAGTKKWKGIGQATLSQSSKFKFKDKVTTVRERKYRVVKAASARHGAGRATTELVTVYGWRDLRTVSQLNNGSIYDGPATINGTFYPSSLRAGVVAATGQIEFNLGRHCKSLDAVYGIDDSSASNSSATITVSADGVPRHQGGYVLGQAQRVVTDVTGVFRITIGTSQTGGASAAVGTPRVLCSF